MKLIFVYEFWTVLQIQLTKEEEGNDIEIVDFLSFLLLSYFFWYSLPDMLLNSLFALWMKMKEKAIWWCSCKHYYCSYERKVTKSQWHKNPQFYIYNWNAYKSKRKGIFLTKQTNDKAREENPETFRQELLYNFFMVWLKSRVFGTKENSNIVRTILGKSDCSKSNTKKLTYVLRNWPSASSFSIITNPIFAKKEKSWSSLKLATSVSNSICVQMLQTPN